MDITFEEFREKEIIDLKSGKKLGQIIDLLVDFSSCKIKGLYIAGEKYFFKKSENIFIPLTQIYSIGEDVVIIRQIPFQKRQTVFKEGNLSNVSKKSINNFRYKRISNNKYK